MVSAFTGNMDSCLPPTEMKSPRARGFPIATRVWQPVSQTAQRAAPQRDVVRNAGLLVSTCFARRAKLVAIAGPDSGRRFAVIQYGLPSSAIVLAREDARAARLFPGSTINTRLYPADIAPGVAVLGLAGTCIRQPRFSVRCREDVTSALTDPGHRRVVAGSTASGRKDGQRVPVSQVYRLSRLTHVSPATAASVGEQ